MKRRLHSAFTLIELLVVVAIIALLISILLPSLNLARKSAKQLICNTNLKEQASVANLYAEDNDGWVARGFTRAANFQYAMMQLVINKPKGLVIFPTGAGFGSSGGKEWDGRVNPLWEETNPARLKYVMGFFPALQCPDYPIATQTLDYVSSAFLFPIGKKAWGEDPGQAGQEFVEEDSNSWGNEYVEFSKLQNLTTVKLDAFDSASTVNPRGAAISPGRLVWVTEAHVTLSGRKENSLGAKFHHFFSPTQIPFGARPRIANDKRHPGGLPAMFFDGHCDTVPMTKFDPGYGKAKSWRVQYVTAVPAGLE